MVVDKRKSGGMNGYNLKVTNEWTRFQPVKTIVDHYLYHCTVQMSKVLYRAAANVCPFPPTVSELSWFARMLKTCTT